MVQRMAIERKVNFSKTALKAHADTNAGTKQDHWVEDVGDRPEHKLEYSSLYEEEGTIKAASNIRSDMFWRNDIYKISDDHYGP